MPEKEWMESEEPQRMLEYLRGKGSNRKLRLFVVACYRRYWMLLPEVCHQAIVASEEYADGDISLDELNRARDAAEEYARKISRRRYRMLPGSKAAQLMSLRSAVFQVASPMIGQAVASVHVLYATGRSYSERERKLQQERKTRCNLLRCIFGNPFRPVALDPVWRTPTAIAIAQAIYDDRRVEDLPILADVLEESGCTSEDILNHCRQGGEHVRGCWVVDGVLGKG